MSIGLFADGLIRKNRVTDEKIAKAYSAIVEKFVKNEIEWTDYTTDIPEYPLHPQKVLKKEEVLKNPDRFFGKGKAIVLDNLVIEEMDNQPMGLFVNVFDSKLPDYCNISTGYQIRDVFDSDEGWFLSFLRVFIKEVEPTILVSGWGKEWSIDQFWEDIEAKTFSNLKVWLNSVLFIGKDLVTDNCIKEIAGMDVYKKEVFDCGVLLQFQPLANQNNDSDVVPYEEEVKQREQLQKIVEGGFL